MRETLNIGIDVGNYDTKTSGTTTCSGFSTYSKAPFGANDVLCYNGVYYIPDIERFPYTKDKTSNDNCFILTVFAIAKEILHQLNKNIRNKQEIQKEILSIKRINIGVGLPPSHLSMQSEKLQKYYRDRFGNNIKFTYNDYNFSFCIGEIRVYPQDFAAVMTYNSKEDFVTKKFNTYYAIDIGGYTVDVIPIIRKMPDVKNCQSLELGVLKMYGQIANYIEREHGLSLNFERIESVLQGENTIIDEKTVKDIHMIASQWIDRIIGQLIQDGLEFDSYPIVFIGGGSKIFKKYIKSNKNIKYCDFIPSPRANADGYKKLLEMEIRNRRS